MNNQKLLDLKKKIEESKKKVSQLEGKKEALMDSLKKDYNCATIGEATQRIIVFEDKIKELETKSEKGIKELETKYNLV